MYKEKKQKKKRGKHLPLSNASLRRFTSLCEPGTLKIPSWWRPAIHTNTYSHHMTRSQMPDMQKCTKNTKQVLPPTHFHCPKLSQHDLLIWQKLTHRGGLWSECSFQPPQESAVQSSAEKRRLEEERWDENAVLKTETECRERCKERGRKKGWKKGRPITGKGNMQGRKMQCRKLKMTEKYKFHQLGFF